MSPLQKKGVGTFVTFVKDSINLKQFSSDKSAPNPLSFEFLAKFHNLVKIRRATFYYEWNTQYMSKVPVNIEMLFCQRFDH